MRSFSQRFWGLFGRAYEAPWTHYHISHYRDRWAKSHRISGGPLMTEVHVLMGGRLSKCQLLRNSCRCRERISSMLGTSGFYLGENMTDGARQNPNRMLRADLR